MQQSNVIENTKNDDEYLIQRIFVAKLTGSQEIPFVNTEASGLHYLNQVR